MIRHWRFYLTIALVTSGLAACGCAVGVVATRPASGPCWNFGSASDENFHCLIRGIGDEQIETVCASTMERLMDAADKRGGVDICKPRETEKPEVKL